MKKIENNIAIEVKNVTKEYHIGTKSKNLLLRDELTDFFANVFNKNKKDKSSFLALDNVSFTIKRGETIGVIGPNGAGKSTILKILSKITYPTKGEVILNGRVASLLEVGTGFNPELTGRENIYLNGAILGMKRSEIDNKFKEIVDFAEIDKFLDTPVKRYSSGMYIRLAFSIAAHLDPEIMLIDEVLAVGDAKFQRKSLGKMDQVTNDNRRTIIFVSHDLGAIKKICKKCMLVDNGKIVSFGKTSKVIDEYLDKLDDDVDNNVNGHGIKRTGTQNVVIKSVYMVNSKMEKVNHAVSGQPISFVFVYKSSGDYKKVNLSFSIHSQLSQNLILFQSKYSMDYFDLKNGEGRIVAQIDDLPLISGSYLVNLRVDIGGEESDFPRSPLMKMRVVDGDFFGTKVVPLQHSPFLVRSKWRLEK